MRIAIVSGNAEINFFKKYHEIQKDAEKALSVSVIGMVAAL
jgi:hypothetical protein